MVDGRQKLDLGFASFTSNLVNVSDPEEEKQPEVP